MNEAAFFALFIVYFFPAIVASVRRHMNAGAICVLNILLGWTFIGWVAALVWASTANTRANQRAATMRIEGIVRSKQADPAQPRPSLWGH